jgi:hypothetical protein
MGFGDLPAITARQMWEMVASDLQEAHRRALLKANGYAVLVSVGVKVRRPSIAAWLAIQ